MEKIFLLEMHNLIESATKLPYWRIRLQSNPADVKKLSEALSIPVHIVSGAGQGLPKEYVSNVLDRFLK